MIIEFNFLLFSIHIHNFWDISEKLKPPIFRGRFQSSKYASPQLLYSVYTGLWNGKTN